MRKTVGRNKHQKAAHRKGEPQVGREQIEELLEMAQSDTAEDRLVAAENLCPCHVRTRIPAVWEALYRLMQDSDRRIRQAAWHTIEDGGKPGDEASSALLEQFCAQETDLKLKQFAEATLNKVLGKRGDKELTKMWLAGKPESKERGKCDFCGATNVWVTKDLNVMISAGEFPRIALVCENCVQ